MKKILFSLGLCALTLTTSAAPRTQADALDVAKQFVLRTAGFRYVGTSNMTIAASASADMRKAKGMAIHTPAYYVVNLSDDKGFVVVSGDDRFKPVLGYCTEGNVADVSALPEGLSYWLGFLADEMDAAIANGYVSSTRATAADSYVQSVDPLCTTKWNQTAPFNNLIPNYATGCVATGMAQVMKFWNYPTRGIGSHTNAYNKTYSADFGATTYDWANMKDEYGGKYDTKAEVNAVATLMLHCGIATDMQWTKDNSATSNLYAAYALINFFGYNKNLHAESRDHVSMGAWKALVLEQLYAGRPICYAGYTAKDSGAGHFFVCDGFDAQTGLFHFNWGWGGAFDGYFDLTALEPGGQGQAGALTGSFNYRQLMLVNVQPTETGEYMPCFDCDEVYPKSKQSNLSDVVIRTQKMSNHALDFKGTIGLALYNADGTLYKYVASGMAFPGNLNVGSTYADAFDVPVSLNGVADGKYIACLAVHHDAYPNKPYPVRAFYSKSTYYELTVAGGKASFEEHRADFNLLDEAAATLVNAKEANTVYQNLPATFRLTVTNSGSTAFYDEVGVCIQKGSRDGNRQYIMTPCSLQPGETKTITLVGKVMREPGEYTLANCYGDDGEHVSLDHTTTITIKDEASALHTIQATGKKTGIYNLQGVRMPEGQKLTRGVYVIDGRRFTVK